MAAQHLHAAQEGEQALLRAGGQESALLQPPDSANGDQDTSPADFVAKAVARIADEALEAALNGAQSVGTPSYRV